MSRLCGGLELLGQFYIQETICVNQCNESLLYLNTKHLSFTIQLMYIIVLTVEQKF